MSHAHRPKSSRWSSTSAGNVVACANGIGVEPVETAAVVIVGGSVVALLLILLLYAFVVRLSSDM